MAVTSALLLVAPIALLVMALRGDVHRRAEVRLIAIVYALPALVLLAYCALWRVPATRIVSELHGIAFRADDDKPLRKDIRERRPGSSRVVVGDVPARGRRTPQALFGTFVFDKKLTIELPPPAKRSGLIGTRAAGLLGAIEMEEGDAVCIGANCWSWASSSGSSEFPGVPRSASRRGTPRNPEELRGTLTIPRREARIPGVDWTFALPFARPVPATGRTYALSALGGSSDRIRSFIAHTRRSRAPVLVPLDANVTLRRGGKNVAAPSAYDVDAGERITFYTLPVESASFEAPGIAERRSVVYQPGRRSFALDFDTPEIQSLTTDELTALLLPREGETQKKKVVALAMGDAQLVDRSLYFSGASESVALQSSALVELSRFFPRDFRSSYRVISPRGPTDAAVGEPAWIGASDLASVRLLVVRPPLFLLILALILVALKVASASHFSVAQLLFAGALEILAGVRLLFGHRVWSMPPHKLEASELGAVAWMMLPWIFLAASLPPLARKQNIRVLTMAWICTIAGTLVSMAFCASIVEGPRKYIWLACHLIPFAIPLLRPDTKHQTPNTKHFIYAAIAFATVRIILLLFGFKESATLGGGRISLSAFYVPAAAILEGLFLWFVWQRKRLGREELTPALLIMLFVWGIPALLTSDIGLALLNVPVFLLLLLAIDRRSLVLRVLAILFVLFIAGAPLMRLAVPLVGNEPLLAWASDANYARFLHFAAPERLQELATKRGESLAITSAVLQQYINSGVFGHGYGRSEVTVHLGDTALRDFAPAVFVAGEWGLAGTLALLVTYALFGVAGYRLVHGGQALLPVRGSPKALIACVAAGTIAIASIYMILANHELVLLTGKNAYLLGLDSAGDVLETFALLLLIAFGARPQGSVMR